MVDDVRRLALGTAQFGMPYGVANASGQLSVEDARSVIDIARANAIDTIDTAVAYGASHRTLGQIGVDGLRVVTKLPAFTGSEDDVPEWVGRTMKDALRDLGVSSVYGLMFHHAGDLAGPNGPAFYRELCGLRDVGIISKLGISVYAPEDLDAVEHYDLDIVQAPYNIVDQRIASSGWLDRLAERGTEVHTRSVFLQGLLVMDPAQRPEYFARWSVELREWNRWCGEVGLAPLDAALRFVLGDDRVDRVLVGIDSPSQLLEIVDAARRSGSSERFRGPGIDDPALVNPSLWKV